MGDFFNEPDYSASTISTTVTLNTTSLPANSGTYSRKDTLCKENIEGLLVGKLLELLGFIPKYKTRSHGGIYRQRK